MQINDFIKEISYNINGSDDAIDGPYSSNVRVIYFNNGAVVFDHKTGRVYEIQAYAQVKERAGNASLLWVDPEFEVRQRDWNNARPKSEREDHRQVFSLTKMLGFVRTVLIEEPIDADDLNFIEVDVEPAIQQKINKAAELYGVTPERFVLDVIADALKVAPKESTVSAKKAATKKPAAKKATTKRSTSK